MIEEIIGISKVYRKRTTIIKEIRERLNIKDGDDLIWYINENREIALSKSKIKQDDPIVTV